MQTTCSNENERADIIGLKATSLISRDTRRSVEERNNEKFLFDVRSKRVRHTHNSSRQKKLARNERHRYSVVTQSLLLPISIWPIPRSLWYHRFFSPFYKYFPVGHQTLFLFPNNWAWRPRLTIVTATNRGLPTVNAGYRSIELHDQGLFSLSSLSFVSLASPHAFYFPYFFFFFPLPNSWLLVGIINVLLPNARV